MQGQGQGQGRVNVESPFFPQDHTFSSIASNSLPAALGGMSSNGIGSNGGNGTASPGVNNGGGGGGGMRPLNSPIAFLTAAAERQRTASASQRVVANRAAQVQAQQGQGQGQVLGQGQGQGSGQNQGHGQNQGGNQGGNNVGSSTTGERNRLSSSGGSRKSPQMRIAYA